MVHKASFEIRQWGLKIFVVPIMHVHVIIQTVEQPGDPSQPLSLSATCITPLVIKTVSPTRGSTCTCICRAKDTCMPRSHLNIRQQSGSLYCRNKQLLGNNPPDVFVNIPQCHPYTYRTVSIFHGIKLSRIVVI